jgi:hypothetical protein
MAQTSTRAIVQGLPTSRINETDITSTLNVTTNSFFTLTGSKAVVWNDADGNFFISAILRIAVPTVSFPVATDILTLSGAIMPTPFATFNDLQGALFDDDFAPVANQIFFFTTAGKLQTSSAISATSYAGGAVVINAQISNI